MPSLPSSAQSGSSSTVSASFSLLPAMYLITPLMAPAFSLLSLFEKSDTVLPAVSRCGVFNSAVRSTSIIKYSPMPISVLLMIMGYQLSPFFLRCITLAFKTFSLYC